MQHFWLKLMAALAVFIFLPATAAQAQANRTWVSGVGDDANPCSRTAPCKTFAGAISKTAPAGEINCLDSGGFGGVTITKQIAIVCNGVIGGVLVAGTNAITINAGAGDRVVLDGLDIEGLGASSINGVNILQAGSVIIRNTSIRTFFSATSAGVRVSSASKVRVVIEDSAIIGVNDGVRIESANGLSSARLTNVLIVNASNAGVKVSVTGNIATISNVRISTALKSLEVLTGGVVQSYGDNQLSPAASPVLIPKS